MEEQIAAITKLIDQLIEFAVTFGFQILGALVFLFVGWKLSNWAGRRIVAVAETKDVDQTLARFIGNIVRIVLIAILAIITLGNFGISIAPLIALAGAAAFGATLAIQGPLSNYGAGLAIILGRPFSVGDTITLDRTSGVVEDIRLPATILVGEDGERISIPNKEVVGNVIVNSETNRVVQTKIAVAGDTDLDRAIVSIAKAIEAHEAISEVPGVQVGVHDFTYGGIVLGARYWVPSKQYFQHRYKINADILKALRSADVQLLEAATVAVSPASMSGDEGEAG
jgi:small conductance mechanosensitive channel